MKFWMALAVALALVTSEANAMVVIDQSSENVPRPVRLRALEFLAFKLQEPEYAEVSSLHFFRPTGASYDAVCGHVRDGNGDRTWFAYYPPYMSVMLAADC